KRWQLEDTLAYLFRQISARHRLPLYAPSYSAESSLPSTVDSPVGWSLAHWLAFLTFPANVLMQRSTALDRSGYSFRNFLTFESTAQGVSPAARCFSRWALTRSATVFGGMALFLSPLQHSCNGDGFVTTFV